MMLSGALRTSRFLSLCELHHETKYTRKEHWSRYEDTRFGATSLPTGKFASHDTNQNGRGHDQKN